jgi:cytochrome o ubiquinol oxidase operon protein cyoD
MSQRGESAGGDRAPGVDEAESGNLGRYVTGLGFAIVLTLASFGVVGTHLVWGPAIPVLLAVLAIAQMGVHLVFFLHLSSSPDQTNNFLALAFGVFVVGLVVFGSMIIMANLNANMMPAPAMMDMR